MIKKKIPCCRRLAPLTDRREMRTEKAMVVADFFLQQQLLPTAVFWGEELRLNKFWLCAACAIYLRAMTVRVSALGWVGSAAILHNANYNDNRK